MLKRGCNGEDGEADCVSATIIDDDAASLPLPLVEVGSPPAKKGMEEAGLEFSEPFVPRKNAALLIRQGGALDLVVTGGRVVVVPRAAPRGFGGRQPIRGGAHVWKKTRQDMQCIFPNAFSCSLNNLLGAAAGCGQGHRENGRAHSHLIEGRQKREDGALHMLPSAEQGTSGLRNRASWGRVLQEAASEQQVSL